MLAVVFGGFVTAVLISEDGYAWPTALCQGTLLGLAMAAVLATVLTTMSTWGAARAASRAGLALTAEAVTLPCTARFRLPAPSGTTAYQLTDSALHALRQIPVPRIDDVEEFTHGKLTPVCARSHGTPVRLRVFIEKDGETATVTMEARPVSCPQGRSRGSRQRGDVSPRVSAGLWVAGHPAGAADRAGCPVSRRRGIQPLQGHGGQGVTLTSSTTGPAGLRRVVLANVSVVDGPVATKVTCR